MLLAAGSLLAAACNGGAEATTTVPTTTLPTTTTTTSGRLELGPNGEAFLAQGDAGSYVEALQFYLVCTGHGQLTADGPAITVDGQFGPMTADAVAWYQAELRRMPTGRSRRSHLRPDGPRLHRSRAWSPSRKGRAPAGGRQHRPRR